MAVEEFLPPCYDVSIIDIGASSDAPPARKGDVDVDVCQNCGGPIRAHNKTGYCRMKEECRTLGNRASANASYRKSKDGIRYCKGCGRQIDHDNVTGYCQQTPLCLSNSQRVRAGRAEVTELPACEGCGRRLRFDNTTGYCAAMPECRSNYRKVKSKARYVPVTLDRATWQKNYNVNHPDAQMLGSAKSRAKERGIEFSITREDIRRVWVDVCPVFGYELRSNHTGTRAHARESFSLDRIDNSRGYVPGNIQILSHRANAMKNDATPDELLQFAAWIQATYGAVKGGDAT